MLILEAKLSKIASYVVSVYVVVMSCDLQNQRVNKYLIMCLLEEEKS